MTKRFSESQSNKFDVSEHEVYDPLPDYELAGKLEVDESEREPERRREYQGQSDTTRWRSDQVESSKKKNKTPYAWAFFLCSLFLGLGFTATFEAPFGIMAGLGLGYLFFVPQIYDKVMRLLDRI